MCVDSAGSVVVRRVTLASADQPEIGAVLLPSGTMQLLRDRAILSLPIPLHSVIAEPKVDNQRTGIREAIVHHDDVHRHPARRPSRRPEV
jgi:hypothetical protein